MEIDGFGLFIIVFVAAWVGVMIVAIFGMPDIGLSEETASS